jgi:hypothetical protein
MEQMFTSVGKEERRVFYELNRGGNFKWAFSGVKSKG